MDVYEKPRVRALVTAATDGVPVQSLQWPPLKPDLRDEHPQPLALLELEPGPSEQLQVPLDNSLAAAADPPGVTVEVWQL